MKVCIRGIIMALVMGILSVTAASAAAKTFTIAPFTVVGSKTYGYLEQTIPQMFISRLTAPGFFEAANKAGTDKALAPSDEKAAEKARTTADADYVVWGSITIVGENCSIDARVKDKEGKSWPIARESSIARLIPDLRRVADSINATVFQRPGSAKAAASQSAPEQVNQMNPGLVRNETGKQQVYINPQFRYAGQGGDESRLRSQALNFTAVGMEICDTVGNGKKLVFLLAEHGLYAYQLETEGNLVPLGFHDLSAAKSALSIRSIDYDRSGRSKLIVNTKDNDENLYAYVYSFDGKNFKEEAIGYGLYLDVVKLPPLYKPQLLGQRADPPHLFMPGVREAAISGNKAQLGGSVALPKDLKVFNFAYLPPGKDKNDATKILMLDESERIRLYSEKGARMFTTEDSYSGSAQGIYMDTAMPGLGRVTSTQGTTYYIPMRFSVVDLDDDGNYEVIVNKPITTAGVIFDNYRSFPQSEIHSLQWDGLGLSLVWKTRSIKGSVVDYTIDDPNEDGVPDLVICLNTHPGALGVAPRKCVVMLYPLDLSKTNPGTQPVISE
ncbi:hypothetical protein FACS1894168_3290 [Deltaproteobacteria bacterium]|nr:hypothetical protein FACS1894168_3290 [Deltaproteobacteria bacterium]